MNRLLGVALVVGMTVGIGCAPAETAESDGQTQDLATGSQPPTSGEYAVSSDENDEFLVIWPSSVKLAADGTFSGAFNMTVFDDEGWNSQVGTTGDVTGKYAFEAGSHRGEGIVTFRYTQNGDKFKDAYKYRLVGNKIQMIYGPATMNGLGRSKWKTTSFADTVRKIGNAHVFELLKQ